jgi:TolB-like protein/tetratricopeptide (TPR) repeat protein
VIYRFGNHTLDTETFRLTASGEEIAVEPQVFSLLQYLVENRERVVGKDEIIEHVWDGRIISDGTLTSRINSVRRAVGDDGKAQAVIRTFRRRGLRFVAQLSENGDTVQSSEATQASDKPSIAVLPFENLSGDPEQEYFADGIAEDIIMSLSRFLWFFVIARNSSFSFKGSRVSVRQVADELGVRYVLEGSVRRSGNRIRITAQLIDATTDQHIWAERYDRSLGDIFAVQDEVTEKIISSVAPGILTTEIQRARRKDVTSLDVWDRIMRSHWHYARLTQDDAAEAVRLLNEAVEIDPGSTMALGDLAMIQAIGAHWGWGASLKQSLTMAANAARHAIEADDTNAWGYIALGVVDLFSRRHDDSTRNLRRAIELSPNEPHAYGQLGLTLAFSGDYDGAIAALDEARRFSPRDRFNALWTAFRGVAAFGDGRYDEAVNWAKSALEQNSEIPGAYRVMAASCGQLDKFDEARNAINRAVELIPGLTIATAAEQLPWKDAENAESFLEGLRKAGLQES